MNAFLFINSTVSVITRFSEDNEIGFKRLVRDGIINSEFSQ